MSEDQAGGLIVRRGPLAPEFAYSLADGALVRRSGGRIARWPLKDLRRFTLASPGAPRAGSARILRLRLGRHVETLVWSAGDRGAADFVRRLAAEAALRAPGARFEAEGTRLAGVLLASAILLGAGAAALALAAVMAGLQGLGLDLAARLAFLLILIFALTPWIGRAGRRRLDPHILPETLLG